MENKKHFKKLIKKYLDLRKLNNSDYQDNINDYISKIYKIMDYVNKLSNNDDLTVNSIDYETSVFEALEKDSFNYDCDTRNILGYIRKYCFKLLNDVFDKNLMVNNKTIGSEIFIPVEEGDLDGISIS